MKSLGEERVASIGKGLLEAEGTAFDQPARTAYTEHKMYS